MRQKLSVLLSAALLLSTLSACQSVPDPEGPPPQPAASSALPSGSGAGAGQPEDAGGQPTPEPEPALAFDPSHTLEVQQPKVSKGGLELPVRGATGYASVQMGLWEEIPPEPEPEPPEQPAPEPEPEAPPQPEQPQPEGDGAPLPEQPQPEGAGVPLPEQPQPEGSGAPAPEPPPSQEPAENSGAASAQEPGGSSSTNYDWLMPAPSLQPEGPPPDESSPQPGTEDEVIYAPGEEPIPEQPEPDADPFEGALAVLEPGTPFTILEEEGGGRWWRVKCKAGTGWVDNRYCLINLPDVVPSMVYNATNSYSSRFATVGKDIPNVTGRAFYPRGCYNSRLERNEFMMPVLYAMSKRICQAQQAALAQGNTLVLYEGYRPHEVQTTVYKAMTALSRKDPQVKEAVAGPPWNTSWFIAGGYSNHQRGFAIDVTLAQVQRAEIQTIGGCEVVRVREYEEYTMPTPIHELSKAAAAFTKPVASHSPTAWKSAQMTDSMAGSKPALALQKYCTGAGLTPLASEWWHFNDLDARASVLDNLSTGGYKITQCLSAAP